MTHTHHTPRQSQRHQRLIAEATAALRVKNPAMKLDLTEASALVPITKPERHSDGIHDGEILSADGLWSPLSELNVIRPVLPDNGKPASHKVLLVNGIMTDTALHQVDMQGLANTGCAVVGVRNATHGLLNDLLECVLNKLDRGDTPAITTLAQLMMGELEEGRPVRVVAHSQGAIIVARALQIVTDALASRGYAPAMVRKILADVSVETYGGAAMRYVDGPSYRHCVNVADLVPMLTGVGLDVLNPFGRKGAGAVTDLFVEAHVPRGLPPREEGHSWRFARAVDQSMHGPRDVYFKHRSGR